MSNQNQNQNLSLSLDLSAPIYQNKPTAAELETIASLTYEVVHISQNWLAKLCKVEQMQVLKRLELLAAGRTMHCTLRKFAGQWHVKHTFYDIMHKEITLHASLASLQEAIAYIYTLKAANIWAQA